MRLKTQKYVGLLCRNFCLTLPFSFLWSSFFSLIGVTRQKKGKRSVDLRKQIFQKEKKLILRFKQKLKMASSEHNEVRYLITNNWKLVMHFVSRESKSLCYKADGGCRVHSLFLYHNHYVRSIKHCLYAAKPQWLFLHQRVFTTRVFPSKFIQAKGRETTIHTR